MDLQKPILRFKNIGKVRQNYHYFADRAAGHGRIIAPVLKSDAYGFGVQNVSETLYNEGARTFFTSDIYEAAEIKQALPQQDIAIYTLHGFDSRAGFLENIYPVLNNPDEFAAYNQQLKANNFSQRPAALQFNVGMNRNGFSLSEIEKLNLQNTAYNVDVRMHVAHLCAVELDELAGQENSLKQMNNLEAFLKHLPAKPLSITATHGSLFIEHTGKMPVNQNIERIGVGLYGDIPGHEFAFSAQARILSVQPVKAGDTVGYDCAYTAKKDMKVAVIDIGYGDGYPRDVSVKDNHADDKRAYMSIAGHQAPIVGIVAMNMTCVDVTDIPVDVLATENYAEIIGANTSIHHLADCAKTTIEDVLIAINRQNVRAKDYIIK